MSSDDAELLMNTTSLIGNHFFAYGSLMCEDIMRSVAGECQQLSAATLHDYQRMAIKGESYPAITQVKGGVVNGVVYTGISDAGLIQLDKFEGEMYQRVERKLVLDNAQQLMVFVYEIKPEYIERLDNKSWSFKHFIQHAKHTFIAEYSGFDKQ